MANRNTWGTPIVLVHGLFMTSLSWEGWIQHFADRGYEVMAPNWAGLEATVAQLRRDPSPIARLSVEKIIGHYDQVIRGLDQPPIIVGHSFGGAFVQVLVSRGLGVAGVVIDSAPVKGVSDLPLSTLRSSWPLLRNPFMRHRAINLTPEQFNYAFTNHLTLEQSEPIYQRYSIPGSRNVLLTGASAALNRASPLFVDFANDSRAPLLFIAGGNDHIVPASVNRHNVVKYRKSAAVTDYKEFPGRTHFTLGQDGWEEVADYTLDWANSQIEARNRREASRLSGGVL